MKPTIRQIAVKLNVSSATVSKALANKPEVNEETRARVQACAKELGYAIIENGSTLHGQKRVAVFVKEDSKGIHETDVYNTDSNFFFYDLLMGFRQHAAKKNFEVVFLTITKNDEELVPYDQFFHSRHIAGVFCYGLRTTDAYFSQLQTTKIPTVIVDYSVDNPRVGRVGVDNIAGAAMAVDHLIALGHRKIGFINGHSQSQASVERFTGYAGNLCRHNIPFDPELVFEGDYTEPSGRAGADYFAGKDISAVFCASDFMAMGAINRFQSKGICVPEDLSVIGFDNLPFTNYCTPRITTIAQNRKQLGIIACSLLYGLINHEPINHCILPPSLVIRESTSEHKPQSQRP
jgi:DNA-binding LacI/PurR family transcriptional regulator